jgi:TPR repeat protein
MKMISLASVVLLCCLSVWVMVRDPMRGTATSPASASPLVLDGNGRSSRPPSPSRRPVAATTKSLVAFDLEEAQALPEGDVADVVASLLPKAQLGDVDAMRRLYVALQRCRPWPSTSMDASMTIDPAYLARVGRSEAEVREAIAQARATAGIEQAQDCRDVTPEQVASAGVWLRRAAEAGDPYARLAYVDAVDEVVGDARQMLAHPEAVQQFRVDAIAYLQDLAQRGMPEAMLRLSSAYASGVLAERNLVLAYGYGKAA